MVQNPNRAKILAQVRRVLLQQGSDLMGVPTELVAEGEVVLGPSWAKVLAQTRKLPLRQDPDSIPFPHHFLGRPRLHRDSQLVSVVELRRSERVKALV